VAYPTRTVQLYNALRPIDIVYVLLTILRPGESGLDGLDPAALDGVFLNMENIIRTFPGLPGQPWPPIAAGLFAPNPRLGYRLDGNMIQHMLDGSLWKMQDKDIICSATDRFGVKFVDRTPDRATALLTNFFSFPAEYLSWMMWQGTRVFGLDNTTNNLEIGPI
jgi:hypothetical protein